MSKKKHSKVTKLNDNLNIIHKEEDFLDKNSMDHTQFLALSASDFGSLYF